MNKMGKNDACFINRSSIRFKYGKRISYASGSSEQSAQTKQTQNDAIAFGNKKSKMSSLWLAMVWDLLLTLHIAIIK